MGEHALRAWVPVASAAKLHTLALREPGGQEGYDVTQMPVDAARALERFDGADVSGLRPTLFVYGLERAHAPLVGLRDALGVGSAFRHASYAATLSAPGAGVGYHADIMDVVIVQVAGQRRWRVFAPERLSRRDTVRLARGEPSDWSRGRRNAPVSHPPVVDCALSPGDALVLPALCPHEGITVGEQRSVSLTFGWFAYTPLILLDLLGEPGARDLAVADGDDSLVAPLRDPEPGVDPIGSYVAQLEARLAQYPAGPLGVDALAARMAALLRRKPWQRTERAS